MYEFLVYAGVGFSCTSVFPQLWKTYQSRKVRDLSPYFLSAQAFSETCFLCYSSLNHQWMMLASALVPATGTILLCALYCKYRESVDDDQFVPSQE